MGIVIRTKDKVLSREDKFGRIGVLMGGPSSEREISLKSGKGVYEALKDSGLDVVSVDIKTDNIKENVTLIRSKKISCAFLTLHGRFGEDGSIQKILNTLKIPYTGSGVRPSKLAMDKIASRKIFQRHGLEVPKYLVIKKSGQKNQNGIKGLGLPLVIKPVSQGSSIGLSIIDKEKELKRALDLAFSFDERVLVEEYISGREVTVGILDNSALPIIEIRPKNLFFDYQAKYHYGLTDYIVPAKLEEGLAKKIRQAAISAHRLLGCSGCSRVDIIIGKQGAPFVLEVNTIPGFTSTSLLPKAAKSEGIGFIELCLRLIKAAYEKK